MRRLAIWIAKRLHAARAVGSAAKEEENLQSSRHKTQLEHYLSYYASRERPGYAVLVTGEWGVGKTFQVRRAIPDNQSFYVSLFGIASTDEIFATIFASMFPTGAATRSDIDTHKSVSLFGLPIGALAFQFASIVVRDKVRSDKVLILDDLERCSVNSADLLGVINRYVEHHGCRVVVIAHEENLSKDLLSQKEKIFGQTIRIVPNIESAYESFVELYHSSKFSSVLSVYRSDIIDVFKESNLKSLRILRHVMEDVTRVFSSISDEQRSHSEAVRALIRMFSALNFEARAGNLEPDDLRERAEKKIRAMMKEDGDESENPRILIASKKYLTTRIDEAILQDNDLVDMIFNGFYDSERIKDSFSRSKYFSIDNNAPAWRIMLGFERQSDDVAEDAARRIESEFLDRSVLDPGAMLHMFSIRMMMSVNGIISTSVETIFDECIEYIKDLQNAGRLKPSPMTFEDREDLSFGYDGYSYWIEEIYRIHFNKILDVLLKSRNEVRMKSAVEDIPNILRIIEEDGERFFSLFVHTASGGAKYASIPILAKIDERDFVSSWMRSNPKNWYWIRSAIEERSKHVGSEIGEMEIPWIKRVATHMAEEARDATAIRALKIRRHIPRVDSH